MMSNYYLKNMKFIPNKISEKINVKKHESEKKKKKVLLTWKVASIITVWKYPTTFFVKNITVFIAA